MKHWKEIFLPRENRFMDYLVSQAEATVAGVKLLHQFLCDEPDGEDRDDFIRQMSVLEKSGDAVRRTIVQELLETFVTPIDREDIYSLSRSIDDILDYADSTVKELVVYQVEPTQAMKDMVGILHDAVVHLRDAIETIVQDPNKSVENMVAAKKMENQIEDMYRKANAELFDMTDMNHIFKVREVYRHLSNAGDRADEAADIIGAIVIKGNI